MNTVGTPLLWGGFAVVVAIMLAIDLLLQGRRGSHSMTMKQAAGWSILWVTLSLLFNAAFWWYLVQTQGRAVADPQALAFLTGYLIEKALAVDNVFVWLMLFSYFAVPPALQRRVLVYGVLGAIVLRTIMIFAGSEGEWKVKKHGQERRRIWRKLHLAVDSKTHEIICADLSLNNVTDSEAFPGLIRQTHRKIRAASADGAYDTRLCHDELRRKKISALIPPRKGAGYWPGEYADRNRAVANQRLTGSNARWKWTTD